MIPIPQEKLQRLKDDLSLAWDQVDGGGHVHACCLARRVAEQILFWLYDEDFPGRQKGPGNIEKMLQALADKKSHERKVQLETLYLFKSVQHAGNPCCHAEGDRPYPTKDQVRAQL